MSVPGVICEIGLNHFGDPFYADEYLDALLAIRPYGIAFQVLEEDFYQRKGWLKLDDGYYREAVARVQRERISFGIALADPSRVDFFNSLGVDFYKILSKDIGHKELTTKVLRTGKPVFVSTGKSNIEEVSVFVEENEEFKGQIVLNHTRLDRNLSRVNLRAISVMQHRFGLPVSFGYHSVNLNVLYAAIAFEPSHLFFFVRGSRRGCHPDEEHAIPLSVCETVIRNLRELFSALGDGVKTKIVGNDWERQNESRIAVRE